VQAGGGAILSIAKTQATFNLGNWVILAGLVLQIAFFGGFVVVAGLFHARFLRQSRRSSDGTRTLRQLALLYLLSMLIAGRNIVRVTEYGMGQDGYLIGHEWTLYVFDAAPMTAVMALCFVWYLDGVEQRPATRPEMVSWQGKPLVNDEEKV